MALAGIFLGVWQFGANRLFDPFFFGTPVAVFAQLIKEVTSLDFYHDLGVTTLEMAAGFGIGASAGIILGVLLARWDYVASVVDPFLLALNSIPRIALAPMLIVWFGIDMASKVFLGATLVFFITFFNTIAGIRSVERCAMRCRTRARRKRLADFYQSDAAECVDLDHDRNKDEPALCSGRCNHRGIFGVFARARLSAQRLFYVLQYCRCRLDDHHHDDPDDAADSVR